MKSRARQFLSEVCGFLGEAFLPPRPELARYGQVPGLLPLLERQGIRFPTGLWSRARLESAYQRLFCGRLLSAPLVRPTAAEYLNQSERSQAVCRGLEMFYRAFGFAHVSEVRPDHLSAQWAFARYLLESEETAEAAGQPDKARMFAAARLEFARVHLAAAVPAVLERLEARARHPFYSGVAALGQEVVAWLLEKPVREEHDSRVVAPELLGDFDAARVGYARRP